VNEAKPCPVCDGRIELEPTGRPARFCSSYCRNFAARKRREARELHERARQHDELADQTRAGTLVASMGNPAYLESRADDLRAAALAVLAEVGEAGVGRIEARETAT
jgi:hypothetical protein